MITCIPGFSFLHIFVLNFQRRTSNNINNFLVKSMMKLIQGDIKYNIKNRGSNNEKSIEQKNYQVENKVCLI